MDPIDRWYLYRHGTVRMVVTLTLLEVVVLVFTTRWISSTVGLHHVEIYTCISVNTLREHR